MAVTTGTMMVSSDHAVPIAVAAGQQITVSTTANSGLLYYADNSQVTSATNQGNIAAGSSATFSSNIWVRSASISSVTVVTQPVATAPIASNYQRIVAFGDSSPGAGPRFGTAYLYRLAGKYSSELVDYTQGGAALTLSSDAISFTTSGGFSNIVTSLTKQWASVASVANQLKDLPLADMFTFSFGVNDGAKFSASIANTNIMLQKAVVFATAFARCGRFYPDTDAAVTYPTGTWNANSSSDGGTTVTTVGATNHLCTTASGSFQLALPSDFRGGRVFVFAAGGNPTGGSTSTFTVDGATQTGSLDTTNGLFGGNNAGGFPKASPVCYITPTLSAGAHTIVGSFTNNANNGFFGGTYFIGFGVESPMPPLCLWPLMYPSPNGTGFALGGNHSPVLDTEIATLNGGMASALGSNFPSDGSIVPVGLGPPLLAALPSGVAYSQYSTDGIHLTTLAAAIVSQAAYSAIANRSPVAFAGYPWYRTINVAGGGNALTPAAYTGCDPTFATNWSSAGADTTSFRMASQRQTQLRGAVTKSAAGVANETIFTLPKGYSPFATKRFTLQDRAGVATVIDVIGSGGDGLGHEVKWVSGTATNILDLNGIEYDADG